MDFYHLILSGSFLPPFLPPSLPPFLPFFFPLESLDSLPHVWILDILHIVRTPNPLPPFKDLFYVKERFSIHCFTPLDRHSGLACARLNSVHISYVCGRTPSICALFCSFARYNSKELNLKWNSWGLYLCPYGMLVS